VKDSDGEDFAADYFDIEFGLAGLEDHSDETQLRFSKTFFISRIRNVFATAGIDHAEWKDADILAYVDTNLSEALRDAVIQVAMESAFYAASIATGEGGLRADTAAKLGALSANTFKRRIGPLKRRSKPRTWTPEVEEFVQILNHNHYHEISQAKDERDLYVEQKRSARNIRELITKAHPNMPESIINQILRHESPESAELAREWTAPELTKKFPKIKVKANTLKTKTRVKAETNGTRSR